MKPQEQIVADALRLFDGLIFLDKKLVVTTRHGSLHPSETHMLFCAMTGMSFTQIASRFGVSKAAVSRAFRRLCDKRLVDVAKDASRKNRASVALTRRGQALFTQAQRLRSGMAGALIARLGSYGPSELETIARFVRDLDDYVRESFRTIPDGG